MKKFDVCVIGGAGHVGLPLSLVFADVGLNTLIFDINSDVLAKIKDGYLPFVEVGGEELLERALASGRLDLSSDISTIAASKTLVVTIGTPVDEFLNPVIRVMKECFDNLIPYLTDDQLIILRSTVCPGVTDWLDRYLKSHGHHNLVAFCPERVVQGKAIEEIKSLPQIISGTTKDAEAAAQEIFGLVAPELIKLQPIEAEFAKLFNNAYRYIEFAATNQFYMLASKAGVDYARVLHGMTFNYPRMNKLPKPGFSAGPCLFKDTMQLSAYFNNQFSIGTAAMQINEGLPLYLVDELSKQTDLSKLTIGLLGMAFKANSDDARSSLSYKLKKLLQFKAKRTLTTDPYVKNDPDLLPLADVLKQSDILILCAPHDPYRSLDISNKKIVDIWDFFGRGTQI